MRPATDLTRATRQGDPTSSACNEATTARAAVIETDRRRVPRATFIDADWRRVQSQAEAEHLLSQARMRAGDRLALQLPLFSEEERAEFIALAALVATLNEIALDAQRRHPIPFDRWLERLAKEARRRGHLDAEVAYSLRSIAAAVGLTAWHSGRGVAA